MPRNVTAIIFALLLLPFYLFAQKQDYTTYIYGDSILIRTITKNLSSTEISEDGNGAFILSIIFISKKGRIDSIRTLNSEKSPFFNPVYQAIKKTENNWLPGKKSYKVIIPFYFTNADSGKTLDIDYDLDFYPKNKMILPVKGVILPAVIITFFPKVH